ncbi:MAG: hypothetical protein NZ777_03270 [Pseudomonadales bacterium]|nr:hypothetical protein [Pseudomonadales bacterium]
MPVDERVAARLKDSLRVREQRANPGAGLWIEFLVAKEQDVVDEQSRADLRDQVVVYRGSKVDARYLRAQRAGDGVDVNLLLLCHVSVAFQMNLAVLMVWQHH